MTTIELITEQVDWVKRWTENLVSGIDEDQWFISPEPVNTNINQLVGHIVISKYFHGVACIANPVPPLKLSLSTDNYFDLYESSPLENFEKKPDKATLLSDLALVDKVTLDVLKGLTENKLSEATEEPNPVAKTKYESLMFCFKHQMWHYGQIVMLKRILSSKK